MTTTGNKIPAFHLASAVGPHRIWVGLLIYKLSAEYCVLMSEGIKYLV
jgi:hypothetical protein